MSLPEKLLVSRKIECNRDNGDKIGLEVSETKQLFWCFIDLSIALLAFSMWEFTDSISTDWKSFYEYNSIVAFIQNILNRQFQFSSTESC